jgi:D-glycero-D-manno-heptose 1,7-bisphosphate phosphatase
LKLLKNAGFMLVVVSNQSGLARGRFSAAELEAVQLRLKRLLAAQGAALDGAYFCPHHPREGVVEELVKDCLCRKPKPGLIFMAAEEMGLELQGSYMIGDRARDVACGKNAGLTSILVRSGRYLDDGPPAAWQRRPDYTAADFMEAAAWILGGY